MACIAGLIWAVCLASQGRLTPLPAEAPAPPGNPTTAERVALGRLLFWDPILSGNKDVACATCHHPAFGYSDALDLSIGTNGTGLGAARTARPDQTVRPVKRNSQTVLNAAFNGLTSDRPANPADAPMFWDLRVRSLEAWFTHVPGLVVAAPSTPQDNYSLLRAAIACGDPVAYLEHKELWGMEGEVDLRAEVPLGQARVVREGVVRPGDRIVVTAPEDDGAQRLLDASRLDRAVRSACLSLWRAAADAGVPVAILDDGDLAAAACAPLVERTFNQAVGFDSSQYWSQGHTAEAHLFLALAHHKAGRTDDAKKALAEADKQTKHGNGDWAWRLQRDLIRKEAERLLEAVDRPKDK